MHLSLAMMQTLKPPPAPALTTTAALLPHSHSHLHPHPYPHPHPHHNLNHNLHHHSQLHAAHLHHHHPALLPPLLHPHPPPPSSNHPALASTLMGGSNLSTTMDTHLQQHHHQHLQLVPPNALQMLEQQQQQQQQQQPTAQQQQLIHQQAPSSSSSLLLPPTNNHNPSIIMATNNNNNNNNNNAPTREQTPQQIGLCATTLTNAAAPPSAVVAPQVSLTSNSNCLVEGAGAGVGVGVGVGVGIGPTMSSSSSASNNSLQPHHLSAEISKSRSQLNISGSSTSSTSSSSGPNDQHDPNPELILALISRNRELEATIPKCGGCHELILDRFILKVLERTWHAKCLQCSECHAQLNDKCFARNGQLFCKEDFFKRYGTKCSACDMGIPPTQVVRRAQDNVYHLQCFLCTICSRTLNTGDEFYLMEDRKLVCKRDYEEAKAKGLYLDGSLDGDQPNKRPRTTITAKQLETLKTAYNNSPKPARHVREQLSQDTGLDMRVVQVWFQNRRAKEKRLKKDAGRTRWSQYFRSMKGSCSPRTEKFLDKDDLKVDYDSFSHHDLSNDSYSTVNLGLDEGASPHSLRGSYMHGSSSPSHYPSSRSPPPVGHNHSFGSYPDNIVYTNIDHNSTSNMHGRKSQSRLHGGSAVSDLSNDSSPEQGFPDFPPSPDSWLGDAANTTNSNPNSATPGVHY